MTTVTRLPAVRLVLKPNVLNTFLNPFAVQKEITRCKKVNLGKIKFAKIIQDSNILMIATDDQATHAELSSDWPLDAFVSGVHAPKPKTTTFKLTAHHVPIDLELSDPEVVSSRHTKRLSDQSSNTYHLSNTARQTQA